MATRNIVQIDAELCDGCGGCVGSCAEGAIQLIDGKARLVKDSYCDGLGACLGECPRGAITITQRDAEAFDAEAVEGHLRSIALPSAPLHHPGGCPGALTRQWNRSSELEAANEVLDTPSALRQWPVQLHLVSPTAPYFRDAELLLAADCAAFAHGDFHRHFLRDHALAIACPKLDDTDEYVVKLAAMINEGGLRGITIVMMQVPCCRGLERIVEQAMQMAQSAIPLSRVILGIAGDVVLDERGQSPQLKQDVAG